MKRATIRVLGLVLLAVVLATILGPWTLRAWWSQRSSNPVRRGVARSVELGCFSCHGFEGRTGIADPGHPQGVPAWSGGVWMMYVSSDEEIRRIILEGAEPDPPAGAMPEEAVPISMPPYADRLDGTDLDDLVAAFRVLAGMSPPPAGSPERRGLELTRKWNCTSCHGVAGSGGLSNPGSFAGFVPGWYGADFDDLVRDRTEFDRWVREGSIPRLRDHPVASFFIERQVLQMPAYPAMTDDELDALWAYIKWLAETDGGSVPVAGASSERSRF